MTKKPNADIEKQARLHQNTLTKPPRSLGRLEDVACWFAARQERVVPDSLKPHIAIFAGDHGVCEEGVSAFPSVVTGEMLKNFATGGAAINVLAKQSGASLSIIDTGVLVDTSNIPNVKQAKIKSGTANILHRPAMTESDCQAALNIGTQEAKKAIHKGANLLIAGDMGIGNTTASACLICLFTGKAPVSIVGRGTGIDDAAHARKISVVEGVIQRIQSNTLTPNTFLHQAGGFEIAAMAGFYLESAKQGTPIIIDGFIAAAAALAAQAIEPNVSQWMLASHLSQENGHLQALQHLKLEPFLDFKLRLGEGSGAALILPLLQSSIALHREMATFEAANISEKES